MSLVIRTPRSACVPLIFAGLCASTGCRPSASLTAAQRYQHGLVVVLPGIEGAGPLSTANWIVEGLDRGGVTSAIEIYDWSVGIPGGFLLNLTDHPRNVEQGRRIAERIIRYRDEYPGAPVHLIGHSGGGGIVLLALEALPPGRKLDMAILLAAAASPNHNLTDALRRVDRLYNFYSELDIGLLKVGTTLFGDIDREHGPSAGAIGFRRPAGLSDAENELYESRLREVAWRPELVRHGASGGHLGWASPRFAREYLAPMIVETEALRRLTGPASTEYLARPAPLLRDSRTFREAPPAATAPAAAPRSRQVDER